MTSFDPAAATRIIVCRHLDGEDRARVLSMLFDDDDGRDEPRRDIPLSRMNEGTPVPQELRDMVVELSNRGWENAAIQSETGLSRQAVSGVVSGARRRAARDRVTS